MLRHLSYIDIIHKAMWAVKKVKHSIKTPGPLVCDMKCSFTTGHSRFCREVNFAACFLFRELS